MAGYGPLNATPDWSAKSASADQARIYETGVIEFVALDHTAKNLLTRAVRRGDGAKQQALGRYRTFKERLGIEPALRRELAGLLPEPRIPQPVR
jgi:hypothetical protein